MEVEEFARATERSRLRRAEAERRRARGRKRFAALGAAAALAFVLGVLLGAGGGDGSSPGADHGDAPRLAELPGGGREIFPGRRVIAFYGTSGTNALGTLGEGTPAQAARRLVGQARAWRRPRGPRILPAFELIGTVAANAPGDGGLYRNHKPLADARRYLRAIRRVGGILIIDVQPGQGDFLEEAKRFAPLLREPDVSLALDPEWKMQPGEIPGQVIGATDAATINTISTWLSALVRRERLPQKLLVVHQFTEDMVRDRQQLRRRPGIALTINVDGFGGREVKRAKYRQLAPRRRGFHVGFKLFYDEDVNRFAPADVLRFRPPAVLVNYQ